MIDETVEAIGLLVDAEEASAALYRVYARCFPEHTRFFDGLAHEEDAHALWVRSLLEKMRAGGIRFRPERLSPEAFREFRDYLRRRVHEAEANDQTLIEALSIAVDLESSFVEKGFFSIFSGDDPRMVQTLQRLSTASVDHLERVRAYLREQRLTR
jgi:hypothetical protein